MKKHLKTLDWVLFIIRNVVLCVLLVMTVISLLEASTHTDKVPETVEATTTTVENSAENVHNSVNDVNNSKSTKQIVEEISDDTPEYTPEQLEILAIIIYQEAGGDAYSDDTRRKVGSVFLNRVNSELFPDTFEQVATQRKQYGTLYATGIKWPSRADSVHEVHAVKRAYAIANELLISGSILPDDVIYQAEFKQGRGIYAHQDDMYFCF